MWNMSWKNLGLRFLPKFITPQRCGDHPDMDVTGNLKDNGFQ